VLASTGQLTKEAARDSLSIMPYNCQGTREQDTPDISSDPRPRWRWESHDIRGNGGCGFYTKAVGLINGHVGLLDKTRRRRNPQHSKYRPAHTAVSSGTFECDMVTRSRATTIRCKWLGQRMWRFLMNMGKYLPHVAVHPPSPMS